MSNQDSPENRSDGNIVRDEKGRFKKGYCPNPGGRKRRSDEDKRIAEIECALIFRNAILLGHMEQHMVNWLEDNVVKYQNGESCALTYLAACGQLNLLPWKRSEH